MIYIIFIYPNVQPCFKPGEKTTRGKREVIGKSE